jgi:hypothetical protein
LSPAQARVWGVKHLGLHGAARAGGGAKDRKEHALPWPDKAREARRSARVDRRLLWRSLAESHCWPYDTGAVMGGRHDADRDIGAV